ncbi:MAG: hypothetical protein GQ570_13755 [Helicobacteraceae bacterium]|nr:hypothetical protein [Helicobacteraceae bacterium]
MLGLRNIENIISYTDGTFDVHSLDGNVHNIKSIAQLEYKFNMSEF